MKRKVPENQTLNVATDVMLVEGPYATPKIRSMERVASRTLRMNSIRAHMYNDNRGELCVINSLSIFLLWRELSIAAVVEPVGSDCRAAGSRRAGWGTRQIGHEFGMLRSNGPTTSSSHRRPFTYRGGTPVRMRTMSMSTDTYT